MLMLRAILCLLQGAAVPSDKRWIAQCFAALPVTTLARGEVKCGKMQDLCWFVPDTGGVAQSLAHSGRGGLCAFGGAGSVSSLHPHAPRCVLHTRAAPGLPGRGLGAHMNKACSSFSSRVTGRAPAAGSANFTGKGVVLKGANLVPPVAFKLSTSKTKRQCLPARIYSI